MWPIQCDFQTSVLLQQRLVQSAWTHVCTWICSRWRQITSQKLSNMSGHVFSSHHFQIFTFFIEWCSTGGWTDRVFISTLCLGILLLTFCSPRFSRIPWFYRGHRLNHHQCEDSTQSHFRMCYLLLRVLKEKGEREKVHLSYRSVEIEEAEYSSSLSSLVYLLIFVFLKSSN